jgi:hypothetical protein
LFFLHATSHNHCQALTRTCGQSDGAAKTSTFSNSYFYPPAGAT